MSIREFFRQFFGAMIPILAPLLGSYLNCVAMRMERNRDFLHGHSYCMSCGHELTFRDLIPVISWLSTGGKCRYCKQKISIRYPITEILFTILYLGVYFGFGLNVEMVRNLVLVGVLFTLSIVDIESYIIPDRCLLVGLIAWVIAEPFVADSLMQGLSYIISGIACGGGMLILSLIIDSIIKKESLGGGDIKLFALMGLYLGGWRSYFLVILSCIIGLFWITVRKRIRQNNQKDVDKAELKQRIPFGPSIAAAGYIMLMYGNEITAWYLSLMR